MNSGATLGPQLFAREVVCLSLSIPLSRGHDEFWRDAGPTVVCQRSGMSITCYPTFDSAARLG